MDTIEIMSRNIFMCASDLAVITGHNPYKEKSEIILKYWKKHFKADYVETKLYMKKKYCFDIDGVICKTIGNN